MAALEVVVVGAGPAGLAAAAKLRAAGLQPTVIDRAESVGSAWLTRYDSFRLHTIRWLSGLPGMAIPSAAGPWVGRDAFVRYLEAYARRFGVEPRFGVELRGLRKAAGRWELQTSQGEIEADRVVFATGACNEPRIPPWPGLNSFAGPIIHSSEYRDPAAYAGSRVLVIGSGNSASEIAADLASTGKVRVEMAVRTPPTILRRDTYGIPTQLIGIATRHLPPAIVNPLAAGTRRISIPNLSALGLPAPKKPISQVWSTGTLPVLDHGFVAALRSGAVVVRPGVSRLTEETVVHSDGSESRPDAVIAATGYSAGLTPILGSLGLLDAHGGLTFGPRGAGGTGRGLYAVGVNVVLSGMLREVGKDAARLVRAISSGPGGSARIRGRA